MYKQISVITFPKYQGNLNINMMPIIFGDNESIPKYLHGYIPLIEKCSGLEKGKLAYLTIHESFVKAKQSQRRPGIHTEGTSNGGWGGGSWGGIEKGLYMASNDGSCRVWNTLATADKVDEHGALMSPIESSGELMNPNILYWMTDRTPHEALPVEKDTNRQFFRLVSNDVSFWWKQHSTENPLGIQPNCKILTHRKY